VQFDRGLRDVFAIQDEIAAQVARALEATLEAQARLVSDPLRGGTADIEAYLTFLRGRALLESLRVADLPAAITAFRTAIRLDPRFAAARVQLARARVAAAQQVPAGEGQRHFRSELAAALQLLDEAIALDPQGGEGYVERGHLRLHFDLAGANADLRRGLELAPSSARAYEGLAAVLFQSAARRREALDMIRQAIRIDPLEPRLSVIEATYLLYGPGDAAQAASAGRARAQPAAFRPSCGLASCAVLPERIAMRCGSLNKPSRSTPATAPRGGWRMPT
jgi:tetratricopeptide (TPR) repeat protein